MALKTGDVLHDRYRIVKLLAQGGFGTLYRAWDTSLERPCVLKENLATAQDAQRQFLREAKILANLSHPNLPRVTDFFIDKANGQYLVMDYVEGQDVQQMLEDRGGPFLEGLGVDLGCQICDALTYLHSQIPPIIHRDIKPANIRLTPYGKAVLVDFGIAKVFEPQTKTTVGAQAVSPGYSPYEQYGKGKTDIRSDIYALGATLYTVLTGQEPPESIQRVVNDPLQIPRQLNQGLSIRTSAAIMRAIQMDPSQRFQSAADFKLALTPPPLVTVAPRDVSPHQGIAQPLPGKPARFSMQWGWIALVFLLSMIILGLVVRLAGVGNQSSIKAEFASQGYPSEVSLHTQILSTPSGGPTGIIVGGAVNPTPTLTPIVYYVQTGDTCSEIAEAVGLSVHEIVDANEGLAPDCEILFSGQILLLPQLRGPLETLPASRTPTSQIPSITQVAVVDEMEIVFVPAGEFIMGASDLDLEAGDYERPQHQVYLDNFWIDKIEITNSMYRRCVDQSVCEPPAPIDSKGRVSYFGNPEYDDFPVINVSWNDADEYCRWAGRSLPSEAEWEKSARGKDARLFPWGDQNPSLRLANFGGLIGDTERAGTYLAGVSPFGVLDLAGNVAEWVADRYEAGYYERSPYKNPTGANEGDFRVIRGGSWFNAARGLRTTSRLWNYPDLRSETIGFRCAK